MALLTFILIFLSALVFIAKSNWSALRIAYSLLAMTIAFWGLFLFACDFDLPFGLRTTILDLIMVPPIFTPLFLTFIVYNYSNPLETKWPPIVLLVIHILQIIIFLDLSFQGLVTPFRIERGEAVFKGGAYYYLFSAYLFCSILFCIGKIFANFNRAVYYIKLHSLYLGFGIILGAAFTALPFFVFPALKLSLNFLFVIGILFSVWITWIPISQHRLFNLDLMDFRMDLQEPKLSSAIIAVNRVILNKLDSEAYQAECTKYEEERERIVFELSQKLIVEKHRLGHASFPEKTWEFVRKIMKLFIK